MKEMYNSNNSRTLGGDRRLLLLLLLPLKLM